MAFLLAKRLAGWRVTRWASLLCVVERVASAALFFCLLQASTPGQARLWTVAKTARVGQLQRQCWESHGQLQRQPQYGLRSVDGYKDNHLSVAMTTAVRVCR